ncbi:hypothetical protein BFL40_06870 [Pseudomonas costantinii]|uniref:Uncharacterized protein n=1 Tax=Pseudomonas costantinii TaxID=168469 RepID=A0A1S2V6U1_9PSED|nr:hypothetical protein BFL40_06870 [Pseudomonas costantinii]
MRWAAKGWGWNNASQACRVDHYSPQDQHAKNSTYRLSKKTKPGKALQTHALAENHGILALARDHPPQHKAEFFPIMRG